MHLLAANSYKLEVDTSALFSIIFVDEASFTDYTEDDVVTLNYTFLGSEPMVIRQGVWTNVQMTIQAQADSTDPSNEITVSDIVIFVAFGNPVDSGLDGTLSLCYVPSTNASWDAVNIFQHASPQIPWNYITYSFNEKDALYAGSLIFESDSNRLDAQTLGGQIVVQD